MKGGAAGARGAAVLLALLLVAASSSVHADAGAAPARRLLGADGTAAPPLPAVSVSKASATGSHCPITNDPNISCPPPKNTP
ncbi:hypothetical protein BS78_02G176200 [Paspalum vaginatum]|nr:hypothetical protein BS78_02G176200 [Paspalum vaginatum]